MTKLNLDKIRSKHGSTRGEDLLPPEEKLWIPSRILPLNWQLGGGIPYGTIIELFGWESVGKSLLAADFAYCTQKLGGIVLWDDAEFALEDSKKYYGKLGVDVDAMEVLENDAIEIVSDWLMDMVRYYRSKLTNNEPILFVCDTIAALESMDEQEAYQADPKRNKQMGKRPKAIYEFYRKRRRFLKQMGVTTIMINQVRDKVGASMFEESTTTPGGRATAFYASQRVALFKGRAIKDSKKKTLGRQVHVHIKKNKVAPVRDKVVSEAHFLPGKQKYIGYSRYSGLAEILKAEGHLQKSKGVYTINGVGDMGSKYDTAIDRVFEEDADLRKLAIKTLNINTISKTRKKMESITSNLYPIKDSKAKEDE